MKKRTLVYNSVETSQIPYFEMDCFVSSCSSVFNIVWLYF